MAKKFAEIAPAQAPMVAASMAQDAVAESVTATIETSATGQAAGAGQPKSEVKAGMEKAMKTAEEFVAFGQGNLEAMVKSGQIWAAGVQDLTKTVAATAQAQFDEAVATAKALATVKSLKEAVELQATLARSSVEKAMTETGKLTEAGMKLAEQAWAPVTARVTLAVEKFGRTA